MLFDLQTCSIVYIAEDQVLISIDISDDVKLPDLYLIRETFPDPLLIMLPLASVTGQANREITGRILNSTTKDPVPYANVYNKTLEKGTISNLDGYFRVPVRDARDSIMVIYIGYQTQRIALGPQDTYTVYLEESVQLLNEIVVRPKDNSYLADLLSRCRNNDSDFHSTAKAYYELKNVQGLSPDRT